MALERTLNDAHRLLREGRVDGAIAAYTGVLEERPDDWPAANRLGDLYMQTGRVREAVEQFTHVAQHLLDRHLLPKAAALYKKVLKIVPEDEHTRMQLAEIAERQGFLVDARAHLTSVAEQRRRAGDDQGAMELERRLQRLSDAPPGGRAAIAAPAPAAARPLRDADHRVDPRPTITQLPADGTADGPRVGAPEPVASEPDPPATDRTPAEAPWRVAEDAQPTELDRQLQLKLMLVENEIRAGRLRRARQLVETVLVDAPDGADRILDLAKRMTGEQAEATLICAEAILEAGRRGSNWENSAEAVRELAVWVPERPEGCQWSPEQRDRLARTDAAARLETMRREREAILQAFPGLAPVGGHENGWTDSTVAVSRPESAVAAAV